MSNWLATNIPPNGMSNYINKDICNKDSSIPTNGKNDMSKFQNKVICIKDISIKTNGTDSVSNLQKKQRYFAWNKVGLAQCMKRKQDA